MYSSFLALLRATCAPRTLHFWRKGERWRERKLLLKLNSETSPGSEEKVIIKWCLETDHPYRWKDQNDDMAKDNGVVPSRPVATTLLYFNMCYWLYILIPSTFCLNKWLLSIVTRIGLSGLLIPPQPFVIHCIFLNVGI